MNRIYELEYYKEEHNEELRLIKEIIQKVNKKNIIIDAKSLAIIKRLYKYYDRVLCPKYGEGFYTAKIEYLRNMLLSDKKARTSNLLLALAIAYVKRARYYQYAAEQAQDKKDLYLRDELDYKSMFDLQSATNLLVDLSLSGDTRIFLVLYLLGWVYLLRSNDVVERFILISISIFSILRLQVPHYMVLEKLLMAHYSMAWHGRSEYVVPTYEEDFAKVVQIAKEILAKDDVPEHSKHMAKWWMQTASESYVEYSNSEVAMEYYDIIYKLNKDLEKETKEDADIDLNTVRIRFGYATCHKDLKNYDRAVELFREFIELYKPKTKSNLGLYTTEELAWLDSLEAYEFKTITSYIRYAIKEIAIIYEVKEQYSNAISWYQKLIDFGKEVCPDYMDKDEEFGIYNDDEYINTLTKIEEIKKKLSKLKS